MIGLLLGAGYAHTGDHMVRDPNWQDRGRSPMEMCWSCWAPTRRPATLSAWPVTGAASMPSGSGEKVKFQSMVISGGAGIAESMKNFVQFEGVPPEKIVVDDRASSTRENALFTAPILARMPGRKVLVTSDFHTYRSVRAFRKAGIEVTPRMFPYAARSAITDGWSDGRYSTISVWKLQKSSAIGSRGLGSELLQHCRRRGLPICTRSQLSSNHQAPELIRSSAPFDGGRDALTQASWPQPAVFLQQRTVTDRRPVPRAIRTRRSAHRHRETLLLARCNLRTDAPPHQGCAEYS